MRRLATRLIPLLGLLILIGAAGCFLYGTEAGRHFRRDDVLRRWIEARPTLGPLVFVAVYSLVGLLALPVWWLQIIAGYCFGLFMGLIWCHLGAIFAATASLRMSRWLIGEWFQERVEPYRTKLRAIDEHLNHNGLLVVTVARLSHVIPFGIGNYLFGVTRIKTLDVIIGTILGGTLSKMIHLAAGANPRLLLSFRFIVLLVGVNLLLVSPLLLRYLLRRGASKRVPPMPSPAES